MDTSSVTLVSGLERFHCYFVNHLPPFSLSPLALPPANSLLFHMSLKRWSEPFLLPGVPHSILSNICYTAHQRYIPHSETLSHPPIFNKFFKFPTIGNNTIIFTYLVVYDLFIHRYRKEKTTQISQNIYCVHAIIYYAHVYVRGLLKRVLELTSRSISDERIQKVTCTHVRLSLVDVGSKRLVSQLSTGHLHRLFLHFLAPSGPRHGQNSAFTFFSGFSEPPYCTHRARADAHQKIEPSSAVPCILQALGEVP